MVVVVENDTSVDLLILDKDLSMVAVPLHIAGSMDRQLGQCDAGVDLVVGLPCL